MQQPVVIHEDEQGQLRASPGDDPSLISSSTDHTLKRSNRKQPSLTSPQPQKHGRRQTVTSGVRNQLAHRRRPPHRATADRSDHSVCQWRPQGLIGAGAKALDDSAAHHAHRGGGNGDGATGGGDCSRRGGASSSTARRGKAITFDRRQAGGEAGQSHVFQGPSEARRLTPKRRFERCRPRRGVRSSPECAAGRLSSASISASVIAAGQQQHEHGHEHQPPGLRGARELGRACGRTSRGRRLAYQSGRRRAQHVNFWRPLRRRPR